MYHSSGGDLMEAIKQAIEDAGYDYAVAIATQAEIQAGAACGMLAALDEEIAKQAQ
jgi:hypothetical protein